MTQQVLPSMEANCLRDCPPPCAEACPLGIDVRAMLHKLQRGSVEAAYRIFRQDAVFPAIVSRLCPGYCVGACLRRAVDHSLELNRLEQSLVTHSRSQEPVKYNAPAKEQRIAVIGAGLAGLTCALRLASKKCQVEIFEKSNRWGGQCNELMPAAEVDEELTRQFGRESYILRLNTEISSLEGLTHQAVYIATGQGDGFGLLPSLRRETWETGRPGVFLGGRLSGAAVMESIKNGAQAAQSIESYLKTGVARVQKSASACHAPLLTTQLRPQPRILPHDPQGYTKDEAAAEAQRCAKCDCSLCYDSCEFMQYYHRYPKMLERNIATAFQEFSYEMERSGRMLNSCMNCGRCGDLCPQQLEMGAQLLKAKQRMHREGTMPPAFHDFWRRDLQFSLSQAFLAQLPPGQGSCRLLFFPGCQMGAAQPGYVRQAYAWLLEQEPASGLLLSCCGALAQWSGDETAFMAVADKIRQVWQSFDRPTLVLACPSCKIMLQQRLPELKTVFIYQLMLETGLSGQKWQGLQACVFDPCSSRKAKKLQQTARLLAQRAGAALRELPGPGAGAGCCSFGGLIDVANRELAQLTVSKLTALDQAPYITYCINCRDIFLAAGKPAYHLLELICPEPDQDGPPTVSQRRENRLRLKQELEQAYGQPQPKSAPPAWRGLKLILGGQVEQKLSQSRILTEDVQQVIWQAEHSGKKLLETESGLYTAHLEISAYTLWVRYLTVQEGFQVLTAYAHRMTVQE